MMLKTREIGLLHPLTVTPDFVLIVGRRRLEAARELGLQTVPVHIVDLAQIVRGEYSENTFRKDFTPSEAVAIGREIEELEKPKAKARQEATRATHGQKVGAQGEDKLSSPCAK